MKDRNLQHSDDWATPPHIYEELDLEFRFDFDPCPYQHSMHWDGLSIEWGQRNFVNPPYSRKLKEAFVEKALQESKKGKLVVMLLPVSTSTVLFHNVIKPNAKEIRFVKGRIPFVGINSKGEYVNFHLLKTEPPKGAFLTKNSWMHDSMIVIF